ncbi:hypothetical protein ScPMuIL_002680 [Solemya velum]
METPDDRPESPFDTSDSELSGHQQSKSPDPLVTSMSGQKKDKICMVCGDRALGYNFNAVSCESCKAFFRRNAHKTLRGRCEGKCDVNVESRSFCKRCRLAKCFTVGMRKDMILNDDQKKVRKQKIIINKLRRQGHLPPEDTNSASSSDNATVIPDTVNNCSIDELKDTYPNLSKKDIETLTKLKQETEAGNACAFSRQSSSTGSCSGDTSTDNLPWSESHELIDAIIQGLDEEDRNLIEELLNAHEKTFFLCATNTQLKKNPTNPTEFVNIAEGFVRRIISLAKHISFFKGLSKDDQIALLKGSVVEIMMLRSAVNYDLKTESWSLSTLNCLNRGNTPAASSNSSGVPDGATNPLKGLPSGVNLSKFMGQMSSAISIGETGEAKISASMLKLGSSETQNLFVTYSKFIKSLMKTICGDLLILKFLIMMSLFSSDRQNVTNDAPIENIQHLYAVTLQKYVKARFPNNTVLFPRILMKLTDLRNVNEVHTKMLLKMRLEDIEPLLIEVFDLPA